MRDMRTDPELLDALRTGEARALDVLLERHAPTVMRFAMKMCRDPADAEDVLQDTLLAAARGLRDLRGGAAVSTWLYTVARNGCIKQRRRGKHAPDLVHLDAPETPVVPDEAHGPEDEVSRRELGNALARAIASLGEESREVLVLRDVEGLSAAEVSVVVGASVDAVKSRLHRARTELRERLVSHVREDAPSVPSDPACPDILEILSRHLEGDVGPDACAAMERHVATCTSCSAKCSSLREAVAVCAASRGDELPSPVAARVRRVVERIVGT